MHFFELLRVVRARQDAFERAKELYRDRLAPDFNLFDFIQPDEMRLSSILAWFLDWQGSHGQGARFLHLFVTRLFGDAPELAWPLQVCGSAETRTEFTVSGGRIDVLVRSGNRTLVIETKAGAGDQPGQLTCYAAYLDSLNQPNTRLIYLTPNGSEPKEGIDEQQKRTRMADGQLHCWSWCEHILEWLAECRALCRADRVATFIDEFSRYIRMHFEGIADVTMQEQLVDEVTRSVDALSPALDIIIAAGAIRDKLLSTLRRQLEDEITRMEGWSLTDWTMPASEKYSGFSIRFSPRCKCTFEFQGTQFNSLIFGVGSEQDREHDDAVATALTAKIGSGKRNSHWVWFRPASVQDPLLPVEPHWGATATPWIAIADGKMSAMVIEAANRLRDVVARCDFL